MILPNQTITPTECDQRRQRLEAAYRSTSWACTFNKAGFASSLVVGCALPFMALSSEATALSLVIAGCFWTAFTVGIAQNRDRFAALDKALAALPEDEPLIEGEIVDEPEPLAPKSSVRCVIVVPEKLPALPEASLHRVAPNPHAKAYQQKRSRKGVLVNSRA